MDGTRMIMAKIEQCLVLALLLIILQGCANPLPPSGGPRDTVGPEIVRTIPQNKTILFNETSIMIEFSEYVDRNKVLQSIMFTPAIKHEASWSGKELELEFTEPLRLNTTYSLTIGTEYTDYAGNRPTEAYTIIFSTGNVLDTGSFSGLIIGGSLGASVFLIPMKTMPEDFSPTTSSSMYKTQIGSNGQFRFSALADGQYRVYALQDMFKDGLYDVGTDAFAMASRDIIIPKDTAPITMKLAKPIDTVSPIALQAYVQEQGLLEIRCSEILLPESIQAHQFTLKSSDGQTIRPLSAYQYPGRPTSILIEHDSSKVCASIELNIESVLPTDSSKNQCRDEMRGKEIVQSRGIAKVPMVLLVSVKDSTLIDQKTPIDLLFSHSIDANSLKERLGCFQGKSSIPFKVRNITANQVRISFEQSLLPDASYEIHVSTKGLKNLRSMNYADTAFIVHFKTIDSRQYGTIKGEVRDLREGGPYIITVKNDKGSTYRQTIAKQGLFTIQDIPAGTYFIEAFEDKDKNGEYDDGSIAPFRFSERFTLAKESITVRPRWTIDGIQLQFREP